MKRQYRGSFVPTAALLNVILFSVAPAADQPDHRAPASNLIDKPFLDAVSFLKDHAAYLSEQLAGFAVLPQTIHDQWLLIGESQSPLLLLVLVAIVFLFFMVWQFFTDWVDHKIIAEMPAGVEDLDEGGRGGSRTGTLLILLRKFVFTLLVILAVMFILSAFGVNIGPLIAGAGIIGLAISFGAQALVTDIFAGIFFLVDDAFRVGNYIDIGTAKGTVDHISLRSVRLRHHLGMVQTIPFGKIDTVTNYSRDYIITKLDIRDSPDLLKTVSGAAANRVLDEDEAEQTIGPDQDDR